MISEQDNIIDFVASMMKVQKDQVQMKADAQNLSCIAFFIDENGVRAQVECNCIKFIAGENEVKFKSKGVFPVSLEEAIKYVNGLKNG